MKPIFAFMLLCFCSFMSKANDNLVGDWRGNIIGHVDDRDYYIKATIENKKGNKYEMSLHLFSKDYSGEFILQTRLDNNKLFIDKLQKVSEFPYPYLHIEDCFSGYFLLRNEPNDTIELDLYRDPIYHKIEEFTNIDGDGNFVPGFECFTSVVLRSKLKDTTLLSQENQTKDLVSSKKKRTDDLNKRKVVSTKSITVKSQTINLQVWDNNKVDGDIISLKLNDEWILTNFELSGEKQIIPVVLKKQNNELLLFAENLGKIPPNTAAIMVEDKQHSNTFILNSDMSKSETVKIIYLGDQNKQ